MRIGLIVLFIAAGMGASAQQKQVAADTVNIHGYIYDNTGKGISYLTISSSRPDPDNTRLKLEARTNERGYFEIKGAYFNDTLSIGPDIHYDPHPFYNQGSRLLLIYLPPAKMMDITPGHPLVISQKRKYPKKAPSFTVTTGPVQNNDIIMEPAKYPGGVEQLQKFVMENVHYPESALKSNIEGVVQVSFTVNKNGDRRDFKVLRGISDDCDDEVLKALKKSPNWEPALDHGQPVATQEMITVQFKLTDQ